MTSNHTIYDPNHPVPEPKFISSDGIFDGWFGIPFSSAHSLHSTEILALYRLNTLTSLYPAMITSTQIRSLVLHTLPFHIMKNITNTFISRIVLPIIPSSHIKLCASINTQCVSDCFTLQPMPDLI